MSDDHIIVILPNTNPQTYNSKIYLKPIWNIQPLLTNIVFSSSKLFYIPSCFVYLRLPQVSVISCELYKSLSSFV